MSRNGQDLIYASGALEVDFGRREVRRDGRVVPVGNRSFEILEVLIQADGEVVSKDELMNRIWPGAIVDDNTVHVHISSLRKALGADGGMLQTASRRGYRLVGSWTKRPMPQQARPVAVAADPPAAVAVRGNLPLQGTSLVGRTEDIRAVQTLLSSHRLVTLTGPGGIGKTRLAIEVAWAHLSGFEGDAWLVELAALSDPSLVPATLAGTIGLGLVTDTITQNSVARAIRDRKILMVLDNCEHLIDAVAALAEMLLRTCPHAVIIATSREPLQIEEEHVYRVPPLDVPSAGLSRPDAILACSAVKLFLVRTRAAQSWFVARDPELVSIGGICRRLDGIPLAIEFAAARAATLGVEEVLARLDDRFALLTAGRRTALPRHQTLRATLDWSYQLLSEAERHLLAVLSIFAGGFTIEAVAASAGRAKLGLAAVAEGISNLVAKSLVISSGEEAGGRWRLLETVRAYALEKLRESGEYGTVARRQAQFFRDLMSFEAQAGRSSDGQAVLRRGVLEIDNLRAALDWCFSKEGDLAIGVALTSASARVWLHASLIPECKERVERALQAVAGLSDTEPDKDHHEMVLNSVLGGALMYSSGPLQRLSEAWTKAHEKAERIGNIEFGLSALWGLWLAEVHADQFRKALHTAQLFHQRASRSSDTFDALLAERMMGFSLHFLGDQTHARQHIERMISGYDPGLHRSHIVRFQFDQHVSARVRLAFILWLQGYPDQAMREAVACVAEAEASGHVVTLAWVLSQGACRIALACGDLVAADHLVTMLEAHCAEHDLRFMGDLGRCFEATLLVHRGYLAEGIALLRGTLEAQAASSHRPSFTQLLLDLADAYGLAGDPGRGLAAVEEVIQRAEVVDERWCRAELLHLKGKLLLQRDLGDDAAEAEALLRQSVAIASADGTLSWELRAATTLARLLWRKGEAGQARTLLAQSFNKFTEGFSTADLRSARALMDEIA
jgi:predicted ATPase/DNA-binding winged helix-turn-helix (wHTH) protein